MLILLESISMNVFNGSHYIKQQTQAILDYFTDNGGIIEITGRFGDDDIFIHALPGYQPNSQITIIQELISQKKCNIIYCISAKHIVRDKQMSQKYLSFDKYILKELSLITSILGTSVEVMITMLDKNFIPPHIGELESLLKRQGYIIHRFYEDNKYNFGSNLLHIITSYGPDTGTFKLYKTSEYKCISRTSLPMKELDDAHPLNLLAQAYEYPLQNQTYSLSKLHNSLNDPENNQIRIQCESLIKTRLEFYEKIYASGYGEEEPIELCKNLLKHFK